jgi:hypothetical protein
MVATEDNTKLGRDSFWGCKGGGNYTTSILILNVCNLKQNSD